MASLLNVGGWKDWRPIGRDVLADLSALLFKSTPYTAIETAIMQATLRGGLGYTSGGASVAFEGQVGARLEGRLIQMWRYWAMCGMVPVRGVRDDAPFHFFVVDASSGYFVARVDAAGRPEVGWHTNEDGPGLDATFGMSQAHLPDPGVQVYVWPGKEPDVRQPVPFRSLLAPLLEEERMRVELRRNHIDADTVASHPPILLAAGEPKPVAAGGARSQQDTQNSVDAIISDRTQQGEWEARRLAEHADQDEERRRLRGDRPEPQVEGYDQEGRRRLVDRGSTAARVMTMMAGTRVQPAPAPGVLMPWTEREQHFYNVFHYVMGWPSQMRSGRAQTGTGHGGISENDMQRMRQTVLTARDVMSKAFTFVYGAFMGPANVASSQAEQRGAIERMNREIGTFSQYVAALEAAGKEHEDFGLAVADTYLEQRLRVARDTAQAEYQSDLDRRTAAVVEGARERGYRAIPSEVREKLEELGGGMDEEELREKAHAQILRDAHVRYSSRLRDLMRQSEDLSAEAERLAEENSRIELVFYQPPPFSGDALTGLAQLGLVNATVVAELVLDQSGLSAEDRRRLLAGIPPTPFLPALKRPAEGGPRDGAKKGRPAGKAEAPAPAKQ